MKLCVFNKFDKQLNIIHKMKLQLNSKLLLMLTLSAACVSDVYASEWKGEAMGMDKPYYFIDYTRYSAGNENAFLSYTQEGEKYYASYSNYDNANLFVAVDAKSGKTIYLENTSLQGKRIKNNGAGARLSYGDGTKYAKNPSAPDAKIGYLFSFTENGRSIEGTTSVNGVDMITSVTKSSTNAEKKWFFISPEQFTGRPKLDAIVTEVLAKYGTVDEMPEEVKNMYNAAVSAQNYVPTATVGELGPMIVNSYTNLEISYKKALFGKSDEDSRLEAYAALLNLVNVGERIVVDLSSMTDGQQDLHVVSEALAIAQDILDKFNSSTTEEELNRAIKNLSSAISQYSNPIFVYCRDMKNASEALGYEFPDDQKNALIIAVANNSVDDMKEIISYAQTSFKTWVNKRVEKGAGFAADTDFSTFILNNSFQMGTTDYWTVTANRGSVQIQDRNYLYKASVNTNQTLSQVISSLPEGTYKVEATLSNYNTFKVYTGQSDNPNSPVANIENFTINSGDYVKIEVQANNRNFTADDFRITLIGGKATEMNYKQSISIGSVGYATCVTEYNLDFTNRNDGLVAYGVVPEMENSIVHLIPLNYVPAKTAFIVAGAPGDYKVPMCATCDELTVEQNQFLYRTTATDTKGEFANYSLFYLGVSDGNAVFKKLSSTGSLAAKKGFFAIINEAPSSLAPMFRISMDESSTNIESVSSMVEQRVSVYTLTGKKLDKVTQEGLYIVNGKKTWMSK